MPKHWNRIQDVDTARRGVATVKRGQAQVELKLWPAAATTKNQTRQNHKNFNIHHHASDASSSWLIFFPSLVCNSRLLHNNDLDK